MAKAVKYVATTAIVTCDKGTATTTLIGSSKSKFGGLRVLETDIKPSNFSGTFGTCKELNAPCAITIATKWYITASNVVSGDGVPCLTTDSFAICQKGAGMISLVSDGQAKTEYEKAMDSLQDAITDEIYGRFPDTPEGKAQAERIIDGLGINEESNPYKLLAWNEMLVDGVTRESIRNEVIRGDYSALGIMREDTKYFVKPPDGIVNENNKGRYPFDYAKEQNEIAVDNLDHAHPIPGFSITTGIGGYAGHVGVDYATKSMEGFSVNATTAGEVVSVSSSNRGYGTYVKIKDNKGNLHIYGHLSDNSYVSEGDYVLPGQQTGASGNTGNSTGPHLHYEVQSAGSYEDNKSPYIPAKNGETAVPGYLNPEDFGG